MSAPTEKRSAERITKWKPPKKDIVGNHVGMLDKPNVTFDIFLLLGMVLSISGVIFQVKLFTWVSCYFSLVCASNYRSQEDFRQIVSTIMVSILSIFMLYGKDPSPMI